MGVRMHKFSSGVIAVTIIAGMFGGCSESPESGLTPPAEGDSPATTLPDSSNADSLQLFRIRQMQILFKKSAPEPLLAKSAPILRADSLQQVHRTSCLLAPPRLVNL